LKKPVLVLAIIALALTLFTEGSSQIPSTDKQESAENKSPENFGAMLGPDDGAAVALLIAGNQRGNLELCD